jgi:uncharacterized integral membrane protein
MSAIIILLLVLACCWLFFTSKIRRNHCSCFFLGYCHVPLVLVIIGFIIIGYIIAAVYFYPRIWKIKSERKQLQKALKESERNKTIEKGQVVEFDEDPGPEGFELDDEEDEHSFFKD